MDKYVIDANIALGWSSLSSKGKATPPLVKKLVKREIELYAPNFLLLEATNILLKRYGLGLREVKLFVNWLVDIGINFVEIGFEETNEWLELADSYKLTTYDAQYLYLARKLDIKLISGDEDLLKIRGVQKDC